MHGFIQGEELLRRAAFDLALLTEAVAVVIIAAAVAVAVWGTLRAAVARNDAHPWADVRLNLGRYLALALEFLLAADVVRTAVATTWEDIGKLAAIAVIRTGLNFFLHRDIQEAQESRKADAAEASSTS